jgi:hypothetical protein
MLPASGGGNSQINSKYVIEAQGLSHSNFNVAFLCASASLRLFYTFLCVSVSLRRYLYFLCDLSVSASLRRYLCFLCDPNISVAC